MRLNPATRDAIFAQDYDGFYDLMFSRDNPQGQWTKEAYRNVQINYEKMRRIALQDGYSAVWCIEDDMLPPPDALSKLLETSAATNAPVVSGLYVLRHGANVPNLMQFGRSIEIGSSMEWATLRAHIARGETVIPISGGCQGCLVIRRQVLAQFSFIRETRGAPDMDLMRFCFQAGIPQMARLDVRCGHIEPSGNILKVEDFL